MGSSRVSAGQGAFPVVAHYHPRQITGGKAWIEFKIPAQEDMLGY